MLYLCPSFPFYLRRLSRPPTFPFMQYSLQLLWPTVAGELSALFPFVAAMATVSQSQGKTFKFVLCTVARHLLCKRRYINIHTYTYILVYTDTNTCCLDFLLSITCAPHCEMQYALCNMSYGICLLHFDNILELSGIFNRHLQSMTFIMPRLRYVEHF